MNTTASNRSILDRMLDPLSECLSADGLQALANRPPDEAIERRMEELAVKANEGQLTEAEQREYELYVQVGNIIAILRAKARLRNTAQAA